MTDAPPSTLRPFTAADCEAGARLTGAFGWPHRLEDWRQMAALAEGVAAEDGAGRVVGTALRWLFGAAGAAIGLIGVDPARQGEGLGRRLTEAVLAEGTTVLHATEAGLPLYGRLGFRVEGPAVIQMQGALGPAVPETDGRARPMAATDRDAALALDRAATGLDRAAMLDALLAVRTGAAVLEENGVVTGFGLARAFGRGDLVGPVVAADLSGALGLLAALLRGRNGRFVRLDVPEDCGLVPVLRAAGLGGEWPAVRMVRGALAVPGPARVFACAAQAWG